jgi:hypothetical protein
LPLSVSTVVHRALEREPSNRFASAREMLDSLTAILRVLPRSIDNRVLGESVRGARERLAARPSPAG